MVLFAGDIDFVTHYRLVDPNKLESYAKAFVVEDDDLDTKLSFKVSKLGIFFSFLVFLSVFIVCLVSNVSLN
jgi:hypothetical protein